MSIQKFLHHYLLPHESNNQKARLLHSSTLLVLALFLVLFQLGISLLGRSSAAVLGYASSISPAEIIRLTNSKRAEAGLSPLSGNTSLDSAALAKGNDMISKGYWAHFAPDGTSPWVFFNRFGYDYRYAGENLARDFASAESAVSAWMNSPTHKQNILNPKYTEIGIGVVEGNLNGTETTIVVQFFGSKRVVAAAIPEVSAREVSTDSATVAKEELTVSTQNEGSLVEVEPVITEANAAAQTTDIGEILIAPFNATKNISLVIVGVILLVLSFDLLLIRGGKIARMSGRTLAHIAYFGMVLSIILILKAGQII